MLGKASQDARVFASVKLCANHVITAGETSKTKTPPHGGVTSGQILDVAGSHGRLRSVGVDQFDDLWHKLHDEQHSRKGVF